MFCVIIISYCFIQVWDLDTFECKMTLNAHTDEVTSLLCWDNFLLSGSSDCTIKVWYKTEAETLEVAYSHKLENVSYLASMFNICTLLRTLFGSVFSFVVVKLIFLMIVVNERWLLIFFIMIFTGCGCTLWDD